MSKRIERFQSYLSVYVQGKRNKNIESSSSSEVQKDAQDIDAQILIEENVNYWSENNKSADNIETIERLTLKDFKSEVDLVDKKFRIMLLVDSVQHYIVIQTTLLNMMTKFRYLKVLNFLKENGQGSLLLYATRIC